MPEAIPCSMLTSCTGLNFSSFSCVEEEREDPGQVPSVSLVSSYWPYQLAEAGSSGQAKSQCCSPKDPIGSH